MWGIPRLAGELLASQKGLCSMDLVGTWLVARTDFKRHLGFCFHISVRTVHRDIIKVFFSPTDAQANCLKNNFKIYIRIDIQTAPTCFSAVTSPSGSTLLVLAKVIVVKIAS
jgi:hypothetical protein